MRIKQTYIYLLALILLSPFTVAQNSKKAIDINLLTLETEFEAGNSIFLKFSASEDIKPLLYCSNSYGSTLIIPSFENNNLLYKIPSTIDKKKGMVHWKLLSDETSVSGQFYIKAKKEVATMETYIGPPSIEAGGTDYTMLVVIPTDLLDNPLAENTLVNAKHQFLASEKNDAIFTENLIAYKSLYSKKESGRMLVSSESLGINSKEFTVNVFPATPTNFTISAKRVHDYADGNQITSFSTSIIKDYQNNVVSDGTFITFYITNLKGNILKTTGMTINGIATSKMIHPDFKDTWAIKAYVDGMAESNVINLVYKQVIQDFNVVFTEKNREIIVGPLQSFMKQMIPDGLQVKLLVYKNNSLLKIETKTSFNGYVIFNLKPGIFKNDTYNFKIETAGIAKEFKKIKLW